MQIKPRSIYLPVEVKSRDLPARILLACFAAEFGYDVVVGSKNVLNSHLPWLSGGIYLDKSISSNKIGKLRNISKLGHIIACSDEESLAIYRNHEQFLRTRVSSQTISCTSLLFSWGPRMTELLCERFPEFASRVVSTGSPRFDLYRPEFRGTFQEEVSRLQREWGPYILVNSNLAGYMHKKGPNFVLRQAKAYGHILSQDDEDHYRSLLDYKWELYECIQDLISNLSTILQDYTLIIRPHPAEDHRYWHKVANGAANMEVVGSGSVAPWLLGAEAVIHNSCTTGLEAFLLGVPVIAYRPIRDERFDDWLKNAVSMQAENLDEVIDLLNDIVPNDGRRASLHAAGDDKAFLQQYISSLTGTFASEKIVHALQQASLSPTHSAPAIKMARGHARLRSRIGGIRRKLVRPTTRLARGLASHEHLNGPTHGQEGNASSAPKFPDTSLHEAQAFMERLKAASGRFSSLRIDEYDRNLFVVWDPEAGGS